MNSSANPRSASTHVYLRSNIFWLAAILLCLPSVIIGCGQVMTLEPTPTPAPTATVALDVALATPPPTDTPAPYTPAPTPTFTATPTPIFYTIQTGDNLLVIASQYGVSASALQEANGILDPGALQVGQELIVPPPQAQDEAIGVGTPTPTPLPVAVQNVQFDETSIGGLWVLGEVLNDTETPLEQVRVAVSLLDENGEEITREGSLVALDLVDVGERAPFSVLFGEAPDFVNYQAFALSAVPAYLGSYYRDLEVSALETTSERYTSYTVGGVVQNVGPEEAVSVQVVLTAYDALDRVIAVRKLDPDYNVIPPGGETAFSGTLAPIGGPIVRVEAEAQGRRLSAVQTREAGP